MVKKSAKKEPEKKLDSISAIDEELKLLAEQEKLAVNDIETRKASLECAKLSRKDIQSKATQLKRKKQALEIDEAKRKMYEELGINPLVPLVEDFYIIAWNDGHSYGMHEVKNHMIDYVDIIAKIENVHSGLYKLATMCEQMAEDARSSDNRFSTEFVLLKKEVTALMNSWSEKS